MNAPHILGRRPAPPKDVRKRGGTFVGPTMVFALMQAMGLINDHVAVCVIRERVAEARKRFAVPAPTGRLRLNATGCRAP